MLCCLNRKRYYKCLIHNDYRVNRDYFKIISEQENFSNKKINAILEDNDNLQQEARHSSIDEYKQRIEYLEQRLDFLTNKCYVVQPPRKDADSRWTQVRRCKEVVEVANFLNCSINHLIKHLLNKFPASQAIIKHNEEIEKQLINEINEEHEKLRQDPTLATKYAIRVNIDKRTQRSEQKEHMNQTYEAKEDGKKLARKPKKDSHGIHLAPIRPKPFVVEKAKKKLKDMKIKEYSITSVRGSKDKQEAVWVDIKQQIKAFMTKYVTDKHFKDTCIFNEQAFANDEKSVIDVAMYIIFTFDSCPIKGDYMSDHVSSLQWKVLAWKHGICLSPLISNECMRTYNKEEEQFHALYKQHINQQIEDLNNWILSMKILNGSKTLNISFKTFTNSDMVGNSAFEGAEHGEKSNLCLKYVVIV